MPDAAGAISLYAVRMRVARLGPTGAPLVGADNLYVTDKLVRVDFAPQYTTTDAKTKTNGRGGLCLNIPERQVFSNATMTVEICEDDPMLSELLGGGAVLTAGVGTDVVGYQWPKSTDNPSNGVSIEVWTEAWAGSSREALLPYYWYPFPKCVLTPSDVSLSADVHPVNFEGTAGENAGWGNGPGNDWSHDSSAFGQYVRTAVAPPAVTNGYAAVVADAATT